MIMEIKSKKRGIFNFITMQIENNFLIYRALAYTSLMIMEIKSKKTGIFNFITMQLQNNFPLYRALAYRSLMIMEVKAKKNKTLFNRYAAPE